MQKSMWNTQKSTWNMQGCEKGLANRAPTQREQCWHIITDVRKKWGAQHCFFSQYCLDEQCPDKYRGIAFVLFPKPKRRLEDCKAFIRSCDQGEQCPDKYRGIAFFLFSKPKRRLEDCKAFIRTCDQDEQCPDKYRRIAFFLFPKRKRRLEDCKAFIRACDQAHDQILNQIAWSVLARLGGRANVDCLCVHWFLLSHGCHTSLKGGYNGGFLPDPWHCNISAGTGWHGVSSLWGAKMRGLIPTLFLSVLNWSEQICPRGTLWMLKQRNN